MQDDLALNDIDALRARLGKQLKSVSFLTKVQSYGLYCPCYRVSRSRSVQLQVAVATHCKVVMGFYFA